MRMLTNLTSMSFSCGCLLRKENFASPNCMLCSKCAQAKRMYMYFFRTVLKFVTDVFRYDVLESRLRGKFASIFKLTGDGDTKDYQVADRPQPETPAVEDIGDFDIDDLSMDDNEADD